MDPNNRMQTTFPSNGVGYPMVPMPCSIMQFQPETSDTFTLTLDVSGLKGGLRFKPGQFCMLYVFGVGEVPISISGDSNASTELQHTIRAVGNVTRSMQKLRQGDMLGVRGPFGTPWPVREAQGQNIMIIAGGIGLAPLRPLIYHIQRHRDDFGQINIYYGVRSPSDLLFTNELQECKSRFDIDYSLTVDHGTGCWKGNIGVVTQLLKEFDCQSDKTIAVLCGPEVMMRFSTRELNNLGIDDERIFLSMERNMQCATGFCGHCQYGPEFICKDGPVFRFDKIKAFFSVREI